MAVLQMTHQTQEVAFLLNDCISELWKCGNCENFIRANVLYKCGRCPHIGCYDGELCKICKGTCSINVKFPMISSISELLAFRCRYNCGNRFRINNLDQHVNSCQLRKINCMLGNCSWNGQFKDLDKHILETHQPVVHCGRNNRVFKFNLTSAFSKFLILSGVLVLVVVGTDSVFQIYNVNENDKLKKMNFRVLFRNRNTGKEMTIQTNIIPYQEDVYEPSFLRLVISNMGNINEIDAFLFGEENAYIDNRYQPQDILSETQNEILRDFECPVCTEPMDSHIFQCINGHVLCERCKSMLETCPVCRVEIKNVTIRNLLLESLAAKMSIECINKPFGCKVKKFSSLIVEHQRTCPYKNMKCPFKLKSGIECNWIGMPVTFGAHCNQSIYSHLY